MKKSFLAFAQNVHLDDVSPNVRRDLTNLEQPRHLGALFGERFRL